MKTQIIYFSQTGHTRKIAEHISKGITSVTGQCDMTKLAEAKIDSLSNYDLVGLGCPVFYFQEPFNVRDFIGDLPELKGKQWFLFCTHGTIIGNTFPLMAEALRKKGILVVGYHDSYADGTLPFNPYPTLTTGHPDAIELEEAIAFGKEIAQRSQRIAQGEVSLVPALEPVPEDWAKTAQMMNPEFMTKVMPALRINMEKCTHCHECEDNCPVKGIDVEAIPPRIQQPCIWCWNCAKICPTLAIEADWEGLVAMAPKNYARYRKAIDDAAARGKFRWQINPDTIDYSMPMYKQREQELERKKGVTVQPPHPNPLPSRGEGTSGVPF